MAIKSLKRHFGWLMIDHSASPGIPADVARKIGLNPKEVGEGKKMECATLSCSHCGGHVILNPKRIRGRGYCKSCDHYICDCCDYLRSQPGYVHHTRADPVRPDSNPVSIIVP
jgi:hypothetical protein